MKNSELIFVIFSSFLVGCQANDEDLPSYIERITESSRKETQSVPSASPFTVFEYTQQSSRQPFGLPVEAVALNQLKVDKGCWKPEQRIKATTLERFKIEQLAFEGVISRGGKMSALISTPEGRLVYVNEGHYIGSDHARISEITDQHLVVNETLPDGLGCWSQRSTKLAMKSP